MNISKFIIQNTFAFKFGFYQSVLNMMPIFKRLVFFLPIAYIYLFRDVGTEKNQQVRDDCSVASSNDGVEKIKVTDVFSYKSKRSSTEIHQHCFASRCCSQDRLLQVGITNIQVSRHARRNVYIFVLGQLAFLCRRIVYAEDSRISL